MCPSASITGNAGRCSPMVTPSLIVRSPRTAGPQPRDVLRLALRRPAPASEPFVGLDSPGPPRYVLRDASRILDDPERHGKSLTTTPPGPIPHRSVSHERGQGLHLRPRERGAPDAPSARGQR